MCVYIMQINSVYIAYISIDVELVHALHQIWGRVACVAEASAECSSKYSTAFLVAKWLEIIQKFLDFRGWSFDGDETCREFIH